MKRVLKKAIATILAAAMLATMQPQNIITVYAEENLGKWNVEYVYDDYDLGYWEESALFMKDGKFHEEAGENAVLVLMDENGNMTEIPSMKNGERIFTKSGGSVTGSYYQNNNIELAKIYKDDKIAGIYYDGTYFGGEEKYYTGSDMRWVADYAVSIYTQDKTQSISGNYYQYNNYMTVTNTGKTIKFPDGKRFNNIVKGDCLICYQAGGDIIYTYNSQTDEVKEIEGKYEYVSEGYFFVTSKDGKIKKLYDNSINDTGISFSAELPVSSHRIGDYLILYQDDSGFFYVCNNETKEIEKIEGRFEGVPNGVSILDNCFFVISKDGTTKELYDSFIKSSGILFSAEISSHTARLGDYLILYQDNSDFFAVCDYKTKEIEKIEGQFEDTEGDYIFIISKDKGTKELYNVSMESTGIVFPADVKIRTNKLDTEGYAVISDAKGYENIISRDGSVWNNTDKLLYSIEVLDAENGYYRAFVNNTGAHVLSKDNSIDVNIDDIVSSNVNEIVEQFREGQGLPNSSSSSSWIPRYISTSKFCNNGDFAINIYNISSDNSLIDTNYLLIFLQAEGYTKVKRFEGDAIYNSSKYIIMGKEEHKSGPIVMTDLVLYDNQYQKKTEIQLPEEIEYVNIINKIDGNGIFQMLCKITNSSSMQEYVLKENGELKAVGKTTPILPPSSLNSTLHEYYWYKMHEGKIEVYNKAGVLIYTGEYEYNPDSYTYVSSPIDSPDGSLCLITTKGNRYNYDSEAKYIVIGYDETVYFNSDDYKLASTNFLTTKNGITQMIVYQTDSEGNKKYGLLSMDKIKKTLTSEENISVEFISGQINKDTSLNVKLLTEADEEYKRVDIANKVIDTTIKPQQIKVTPYEITLLNNENQPVQPHGKVTVKIPCPQDYISEKCKVYYANTEGELTDMEAVYANGYLSFETTHFSTYLVTETELKSKPKTVFGDVNGDGDVNTKDAVLLKKHLAGYEGLAFDSDAADVNADGNVDSKDAVRLLRHLAGYEVILGK